MDHTIEVDSLELSRVQRASRSWLSAGGKGINIARAVKRLGGSGEVIGVMSGATGLLLRSLAQAEKLTVHAPDLEVETRIATILVERATKSTTVINGRGHRMALQSWSALTQLVEDRLPGATALVCTGSLPPGVGDDAYRSILDLARQRGVMTLVDANAGVLCASLDGRPDVVKVNLEEARSVLQPEERDWASDPPREAALDAAQRLHKRTGGTAIVTVAEGAALASMAASAWMIAPQVATVNEVGAGDSFLAGFVLSLGRDAVPMRACQLAVAVAAASVETDLPAELDVSRVKELEDLVQVTIVP